MTINAILILTAMLCPGLASAQTLKGFTLGEAIKLEKASDLCPAGFKSGDTFKIKEHTKQMCFQKEPGTIADLKAKQVTVQYLDNRLEYVSYHLASSHEARALLSALKEQFGPITGSSDSAQYWALKAGASLTWFSDGAVSLSSKKWSDVIYGSSHKSKDL
jgi:hypothetical protein